MAQPHGAPEATGQRRRARLAAARLYLVCDCGPGVHDLGELVAAALAGGVDVVQLRDKHAEDRALLASARVAGAACAARGALFVLNDRPDLAVEAGADGVHVGQDDVPVAEARAIVGPDMLIGLSTHAPSEIDAASPVSPDGAPYLDYIGVGPVHATPTKPGRPAVGTELVSYASAHARVPFFAIGGIDATNIATVLDAGAERVCVLRAIADADDPRSAAEALRGALDVCSLRDGDRRA